MDCPGLFRVPFILRTAASLQLNYPQCFSVFFPQSHEEWPQSTLTFLVTLYSANERYRVIQQLVWTGMTRHSNEDTVGAGEMA